MTPRQALTAAVNRAIANGAPVYENQPAPMSKGEAVKYLQSFSPYKKIAHFYDRYPKFADACNVALPGFEYPDWDQRTVDKFLRHVRRDRVA